MQNQQGITTHLLDRAATLDLEPGVAPQVIGAIYCPDDGVADHTMTTRSGGQSLLWHRLVRSWLGHRPRSQPPAGRLGNDWAAAGPVGPLCLRPLSAIADGSLGISVVDPLR